jgi:hypothetical protein
MALVAMACSAVVPAAQAQGGFFVAGQAGQATYDDSGYDEDSANTSALSVGYRWQAGSVAQIGVEVGGGKVDEIGQEYNYNPGGGYSETGHVGMDSRYAHIGGNARISFGRDSRWFAIGRLGYMGYTQDQTGNYAAFQNGTQVDSLHETYSEDGGGAYFGAGLGMDITPNFNVNVMVNGYAYSSIDEDGYLDEDVGTASTTTLGLEVRF